MAKLTDQLSTDMNVKPVRSPAAPSRGLATGINAISQALDVFSTTNRRSKAEEAAKASAARAEEEYTHKTTGHRIPYEMLMAEERAKQAAASSGGIDYSSPLEVKTDFSVFDRPSSSMPGDLQAYADESADRLSNVRVAVSQGRLPAISLHSAQNKEFMALASRFPDHVGEMTDYLKKLGVTPSVARETIDEQDSHDNLRESGQKFENDMFEVGAANLNPEEVRTLPRNEVIDYGINQTKVDNRIDRASKRLTMTLQQKDLAQKGKDFAQEDADREIGESLVVSSHNYFNPIKTSIQQSMLEISKLPLPEQEKAFQLWAPKLNQLAENAKAQLNAKAIAAGMSPAKLKEYMELVSKNFDGALEMFGGEFSVAKAKLNALNSLETSLGLKANAAFPVYSYLEKAGMGSLVKEAMAEGILANPAITEPLKKELQGATLELGKTRASTHLTNIAKILKGENTIQSYSPTAARLMMPSLYHTAIKLTADYANGKDVPADTMLNGISNVINAARTLGPGSGLEAWAAATGGAMGRDARRALIKASKDPQHNDMAEAAISGSRASSANAISAMNPHINNYNVGGWSIERKDGRLVSKQVKVKVGGGAGVGAPAYAVNIRGAGSFQLLPQPKNMDIFIKTYNTNLENLVALNDYDPAGAKGATPLEIQKFYAEGAMSKPFDNRAEGIDYDKRLKEQFDIVEKAFDEVPNMNENVTSVVDKPRVMNSEARAAGFKEVPESVKTLGHASAFAKKVNAAGVPSSAMGTYQIVGTTLREFAPKVFGEDWESVPFNAANQDKVAEAIFNERKGTAASLKSTWVSLSLVQAEQVRKMPWSQAKGIIARGESG